MLKIHEITEALESLIEKYEVLVVNVYIDPPCSEEISNGGAGEEGSDSIDQLNWHDSIHRVMEIMSMLMIKTLIQLFQFHLHHIHSLYVI